MRSHLQALQERLIRLWDWWCNSPLTFATDTVDQERHQTQTVQERPYVCGPVDAPFRPRLVRWR